MADIVAPSRTAAARRRQGRPVPGKNEVGRERLLAATEKLLRILPPARVTISRIAREADADPALIRYYFGDRTALLLAVVDRVTAHPSRAAALDRPPAAVFADHIGKTVEMIRSAPFMHRLMIDELGEAGDEQSRGRVRAMNRDLIRFYADVLRADGGSEFVDSDPLFLLIAVLGTSDFFFSAAPLIRELLPEGADEETLADDFKAFLVRLIMDGLRKRQP